MRPTFMGFETCKRGIMTSQKVLDIVGQNISNMDTAGYTRQRVDVVSVSTSVTSTRYGGLKGQLAGQGVEMLGVSQVRDSFLDKRFRDEYSDAAYSSKATDILSDIRNAVKEFNNDSAIGSAVASMYNACEQMTSNASSASIANLVMTSFQNMTQVLHELSSKLNNAGEQQKFNLDVDVQQFNKYTERLAELNTVIKNEVAATGDSSYFGPNELLDERNLILDELAQYGDLDVTDMKDGTVTVKMGGNIITKDGKSDRLNMTKNNDGTVSLRWNSTGKDIVTTAGSLKASTDFINGRGPNMMSSTETSERGLVYYKDRLDTFANAMAGIFNRIIPTATDDNGNPVPDGSGNVTYKTLFGARINAVDQYGDVIPGKFETTNDIPVTASNIALSDAWLADSNYVMAQTGSRISDYANQMKQYLAGQDGTPVNFYSHGETYTGSFLDYMNNYTVTLESAVSYQSGRQTATASIADEMLDRRDEVSGVSKDEETVTMMSYSKAYQAISRVMNALDEALDVLINRTGMVGR